MCVEWWIVSTPWLMCLKKEEERNNVELYREVFGIVSAKRDLTHVFSRFHFYFIFNILEV